MSRTRHILPLARSARWTTYLIALWLALLGLFVWWLEGTLAEGE